MKHLLVATALMVAVGANVGANASERLNSEAIPTLGGVGSYEASDSVRIQLRTSPGAEIGIDGDISSTNLMRTKVTAGRHTVTVTYGTSFQKEYTIDVSPANTEFEFLLDGELQLTSTPSNSKVFLDGMEQGRTPMTLNFLGEHNLRLENDHVTYFDYNERIGLKPFEQTTLNVPMRKRPPRTYGMVLANYAPDVTGAGLTLAFVKRWGLYVRFLQNFESQKDFEKPETTVSQAGYYKGTKVAMKIFTAGLMVRCNKHIYVYGGAGTGNYCKTLTFEAGRGDDEISPYGAKGLAADAGIILKWKALLLQGGYNMILGENNPSPYKGLYVGLGITIHKQRKDK